MSTIYSLRIPYLTLDSLMFMPIVGIYVIGAAIFLAHHLPSNMISTASAAEVGSAVVSKAMDASQKSWSNEWYEVHKAIPANVAEDIPTF